MILLTITNKLLNENWGKKVFGCLPSGHTFDFLTLQVADDDFVVVGAGEEVMGAWREAHRADVATVGAVRLHHAGPSDVVQQAGAVLLPRGQQAAAGIHRHRGHGASCSTQPRRWSIYSVAWRNQLARMWRRMSRSLSTCLSRAEWCRPLARSWALAGPRSAPSCPGSLTRSSSRPTWTLSERDLLGQNATLINLVSVLGKVSSTSVLPGR